MHRSIKESSLLNPVYKHIWIVGAGHYGRETLGFLRDVQAYQGSGLPVAGFLDDFLSSTPDKVLDLLGESGKSMRVLPASDFVPQEGDVFINTVSRPENKKKLLPLMLEKNARFITLIHPSSHIGYNNRFGVGCTVAPYAVCTTNIKFGSFVSIFSSAVVANDVRIGDYSTVMTRSFVGSCATVGDEVSLNSGSMVTDHAAVGDRAVIGMGSVILRKAKPGCVYFGSPATPIGKR